MPAQPGNIESIEGETIGTHAGLMFYTYGQRQGLGIGGIQNKPEAAWYVVDKDLSRNALIVAQGNKNKKLYSDRLIAQAPVWINKNEPKLPLECTAKIRYRQSDQDCRVESFDAEKIEVIFMKPQRAVTPGQYIVFYDDDRCLGGAIIEQCSR